MSTGIHPSYLSDRRKHLAARYDHHPMGSLVRSRGEFWEHANYRKWLAEQVEHQATGFYTTPSEHADYAVMLALTKDRVQV